MSSSSSSIHIQDVSRVIRHHQQPQHHHDQFWVISRMISLHRPAQLLSLPHSGFSIFLACSLAHVLTDLLAGSVCLCCSSAVVGTPKRTSASRFHCKINVLSQAYMSSPTGCSCLLFILLKNLPDCPILSLANVVDSFLPFLAEVIAHPLAA